MKFSLIAGALALVAATAAQAAPVTFQFTGTLDSSDIAGYEAGTLVSGEFSYDTDTAPAAGPEPLSEGFQLVTYGITAPGSFKFNIGGDAVSFTNLGVVIFDSNGLEEGGEFMSISAEGMTVNGTAGTGVVSLVFGTEGGNPDVLTTALPATLNLADFDVPFVSPLGTFAADSSSGQSAMFTVTSLTAATTAVPEPSTAISMLIGLGLMGGLMSRRRAG